jgi:hypothetical protein
MLNSFSVIITDEYQILKFVFKEFIYKIIVLKWTNT